MDKGKVFQSLSLWKSRSRDSYTLRLLTAHRQIMKPHLQWTEEA